MRLSYALVLAAAALGCANQDGSPRSLPRAELAEQIEAGTAPTIVDVRTGGEYERDHVPDAIHIPFWSLWSRSNEIPTSHDEPVVLYCEHGPRAWLAEAMLRSAGFETIALLEGHMSAWRRDELPVTEGL